ncbi:MAG: HD domain-containing protein [Peptococcaceae bacterium]|nr:HD domain-containing protein [Peptococcaceae bacterium]
MKRDQFSSHKMDENHFHWKECITRQEEIYERQDEVRSPFARDYTRLLHCTAYRRLKHKTQVFFAPLNDHICTRIEHVNHVASVSHTISASLGLNTELAAAIAIGHDIGHAPFGHTGEAILSGIASGETGCRFWHEQNSLRFADFFETLPDPNGNETNLNLTYAVRDGIILHCGEYDENQLIPRNHKINLYDIVKPGQYAPYTWEGCVVKFSDKIAYIGRDIEDALTLNILTFGQLRELTAIIKNHSGVTLPRINNTVLINCFISDLCQNSSPEKGIGFSDDYLALMSAFREFMRTNVYVHKRLEVYQEYAKLIIESIYATLKDFYRAEDTVEWLRRKHRNKYPLLTEYFAEWILKFSDLQGSAKSKRCTNASIYKIGNPKDYNQAVIDFITGMTDSFALRVFGELTSF